MSWTFPYLGETKELNETARRVGAGSFVQLSDGYTHYELDGLENGQPVTLVHGFSVPYFIWDPTFEFLIRSGFRVLRYDLIGRGFSDRPRVRYDIDLFCKQLKELLDTLGFEQISLMGLSMGGPITAAFTTRFPKRVQKLVLIDPAGARPVTLPRILKALTTPGFGELALGLFGRGRLLKDVESDFYDPAHVKAFVEKYMVPMKYKGFMRAILSTMRNGMLGDFSSTYRKVGELGAPTLLLWGRDDKTVPFEHSNDLRAAIPQAELRVFEHCGHIPHYERPDEVNPILLEFLK
ncbi:MAG: alpha/beta hydrolase [Anaerolineales bacterium]|nr:alpha/beta hydrolase [Anaerolineales bacterium]